MTAIHKEMLDVNVFDEEFSIPLDISDILDICQEYNKLGTQIQYQITCMLEYGFEESIRRKIVKRESLPLIRNFLKLITKNPYFGDASSQAQNCINLIDLYCEKNKPLTKCN